MTKDPVCKMALLEDKAEFKLDYRGVAYYFCGKGCMERFEKDPEKYVSREGADWIEG